MRPPLDPATVVPALFWCGRVGVPPPPPGPWSSAWKFHAVDREGHDPDDLSFPDWKGFPRPIDSRGAHFVSVPKRIGSFARSAGGA